MDCNSRTLNTLAASSDLETLRAELNRALGQIEAETLTIAELGAELVRLGVVITLPVAGPVPAMAGLHGLLNQLAGEFPEMVGPAREMASRMSTEAVRH